MGLYKKISEVMKEIEYLSKDDNIEFGKTKYRAISEEKVTTTVRDSLIKHGLIILPVEQEHFREDTILKDDKGKESISRLSTVNTKYKIIDIDTGENETIVSSGTGVDTQDKGVGKAMTYAYKYMLLRTFAIPTGEDSDKISSEELDDKQGKNLRNTTEKQSIQNKPNPTNNDVITENQAKRLFALAKGNTELVKKVLLAHGYTESKAVKKAEYEQIAKEIQEAK